MTRQEMESEVSRLLLEQRRLARLGLSLSPNDLMLLKRLLYRLGLFTSLQSFNGLTRMSRNKEIADRINREALSRMLNRAVVARLARRGLTPNDPGVIRYTEDQHVSPTDSTAPTPNPSDPPTPATPEQGHNGDSPAAEDWDGTIDEDEVRADFDPYREDAATFDRWSRSGERMPQRVHLESGTYTPPGRSTIPVFRWYHEDHDGDRVEEGEWTADDSEADSQADQYATDNNEDPPDPDDDDIPNDISGEPWGGRESIASYHNRGEDHDVRLEEATFEFGGGTHEAYRWTTRSESDGDWTLDRSRAIQDGEEMADPRTLFRYVATFHKDYPNLLNFIEKYTGEKLVSRKPRPQQMSRHTQPGRTPVPMSVSVRFSGGRMRMTRRTDRPLPFKWAVAKKKSRRGLPIRMAKVDGHQEAHPAVAGFPIEFALRHFANDPKNTTHVRDLASHVLKTGDSSGLWGLHDALRESDHPMATTYNWMSAGDKVQLDKHTKTALNDIAAESRVGVPEENHHAWWYRPEHVAERAERAMRKGDARSDHFLRRDRQLLNRVRQLAMHHSGVTDPKLIDESIRRHASRAWYQWARTTGNEHAVVRHQDDSLKPLSEVSTNDPDHEKTVKATRYSRLTVGKGEPLMGGQDFMHEVHDEAGNRVGHLWVTPAEGGTHLHVNHVGMMGHDPNATGIAAIRDVRRQLKAMYPTAQTIGGTRISGSSHANTGQPRSVRTKLRRRLPVKRYAVSRRGDFIDSLRLMQSSNQKAMHQVADQVAKQLGLEPTKVYNALHDTPHGAVPGVAQAVYGQVSPEALHAAAAWIGLTSNAPGVAVFHPRPNGPDFLHRVRMDGSGMDARVKLDRFGLRNRIIIPHKKGMDILIPDPKGSLTNSVERFANHHHLTLETSPGHFKTIGAADQARAREVFRNKVVAQEQGTWRHVK